MTAPSSAHPVPKVRGLGLTGTELRDVLGLSGIFALRLLGLFLLMPVLSVYALGLAGATPMLAGLSVGVYGLSQMILQLPFGMLSDRFNRKHVIALGLAIYAAGSVLAATSTGIAGLMLGRLLQGSGAIASVVIAMVADLTRDEVRGRAMAIVGVSIGFSFTAGFLAGPVLGARWGVRSLFWLLAIFDSLAIVYLYAFIPNPARPHKATATEGQMRFVLADRNLTSLDVLMFILHTSMTATFVVTPLLLKERWAPSESWKVYLPMILAGGGLMLPAMAFAEMRKKLKELIGAGIAVCFVGEALLAASALEPKLLVPGLIVFFVGFNFVEPGLPSLVTRFAPSSMRGAAVGAFNMSQYMGAAAGGALGGWFLGHGRHGLYFALMMLCVPWLWALSRLEHPKHLKELRFPGFKHPSPLDLRRLDGVYDAKLVDGELEVRFSSAKLSPEKIEAHLKAKGWV